MVQRWTVTFSFTYALVTFCPLVFVLIASVIGISITKEIDSTFLSGFIAASGIFAGFLVSSAISRREVLDFHHYLMLFSNLGIFFFVLNVIFIKHLVFAGQPDLVDFALVMVTVNANAFTAIHIALDLAFHEFMLRIPQFIKEALRSGKHEDLRKTVEEILKES